MIGGREEKIIFWVKIKGWSEFILIFSLWLLETLVGDVEWGGIQVLSNYFARKLQFVDQKQKNWILKKKFFPEISFFKKSFSASLNFTKYFKNHQKNPFVIWSDFELTKCRKTNVFVLIEMWFSRET